MRGLFMQVNSCIIRLQKGFVINGKEAVAILMLFQFTDTVRRDIKMGMEQNLLSNNALNIFLETVKKPFANSI